MGAKLAIVFCGVLMAIAVVPQTLHKRIIEMREYEGIYAQFLHSNDKCNWSRVRRQIDRLEKVSPSQGIRIYEVFNGKPIGNEFSKPEVVATTDNTTDNHKESEAIETSTFQSIPELNQENVLPRNIHGNVPSKIIQRNDTEEQEKGTMECLLQAKSSGLKTNLMREFLKKCKDIQVPKMLEMM